jgi:hypothetical protein
MQFQAKDLTYSYSYIKSSGISTGKLLDVRFKQSFHIVYL